MKKILLSAAIAFTAANSVAQSNFFEKTCYRGAFAPAPAPMWTDQWCEWDPQNKVYPAPTITITSDITSNTTWNSGSTILLSAQCFVKNNSVLTIQPGVTILGDKSAVGAGIFVTKGSQLIANGTPAQPIVFTSNQAPGNRSAGDWGGIILMGKANNNTPGGINNIEGLPISTDTEYGVASGADDNDNSGSLTYVRIEFAGYAYQQDKEINTLTMGAVGRGTTLHHIQASFGLDDAFEWFGGTVNAKYLVSFRCLDDDFDTDFGWSGNVQFGLAVRDPEVADNPAISTSENFESDNNATGTSATPKTSGMFSNITCIGPLRGVVTGTYASGYRRGARIRRNSELKIFNSIFMDNATRGVFIDGSACETNASAGTLKFKNNILAGYGQRATESGTFGIINTNTFVIANGCDTLKSSAGILTTPYNYTSPDYRPSAGSIALSGASFTDAVIAALTDNTPANVIAAIPSTVCIGTDSNVSPFAFAATTTVSPGYCSLSWSVSPGVSISNTLDVNPSFTVSTIGTYSVFLTVSNGDGMVTNIQAITTTTCLDVAVAENKSTIGRISMYPNPGKDFTVLNIQSEKTGVLNVKIYDITGKLAMSPIQNQSLNNGENKFTINTSELQNGIYFVTLQSENRKETVKLIVNK